MEIRDSGDDNEDEGRSNECCWAALLVIGHQAPKSTTVEPHFFFIIEDLQICGAGSIFLLAYFFPPSALTLGPAVELVRMSGGAVGKCSFRLGCARADPDDHSGRVKYLRAQGCPGRLGRARYRV